MKHRPPSPPGAPPPPLPRRQSLVAQTAQALREGLASGHWSDHLPGERELSDRLQVGRNTLRAALEELRRQGLLDVSPRKRRGIRTAPSSSPSSPMPPSSRPAGNKPSRTVALLAPIGLRLMPPAAVLLVDALRDQLSKMGWTLDLQVSPRCFSRLSTRPLESLVAESRAAAWLLYGSHEAMQRWFLDRELPCLVVGTAAGGMPIPSIDADHRATCRHAGNLLLRKGHRRLALVLPESQSGGDLDSERGMREALASQPEAGLLLLRHRAPDQLQMLLDHALASAQPPTAFVVARAVHALTVAMHLQRRQLRLPQDAAVLCRDDEAFLAHTSPVVSRYALDSGQFVRKVSKAVRDLVSDGPLPTQAIRLFPKLVDGETL